MMSLLLFYSVYGWSCEESECKGHTRDRCRYAVILGIEGGLGGESFVC